MTKHVEIWTLSKESRVVPLFSDKIEFFEYYPPPDMYVMDGKFEDRVERKYMDIIRVSKHEKIYDRLNTDPSDLRYNTTDKYIAIHPDVEEAISVKWQEKIDKIQTVSDQANKALAVRAIRAEGRLRYIRELPWYKRVWSALWNSI